MTILASKEFAGRGTGQEGGLKAANYIAEQFKSYGLKPVGKDGSFFQDVKLLKTNYDVQNLTIGNQQYVNGKDYFVQGDNAFEKFSAADIIFIGYGIQDEKYNDLQNLNIKDKIVLLINEGEPTQANGNSIITGTTTKSTWSTNRFKRVQELIKLQPKVILATSSQVAEVLTKFKGRLNSSRFKIDKGESSASFKQSTPVVNITEEVANQLLKPLHTSVADYKSKPFNLNSSSSIIPIAFNATMGMKAEKVDVPNVLGLLEGTTLKMKL